VSVLCRHGDVYIISSLYSVFVSLVLPLTNNNDRIVLLSTSYMLKVVGYLHASDMHLDFVVGIGRHDRGRKVPLGT
jgi:hypothetical protein